MNIIRDIIQNNLIFIIPAFLALFLIFSIWIIVIHKRLNVFKKRNQEFFAGGEVKNLEELLLEQAKTIRLLDKDIQELYNISNQINNLSLRSIHKVSLIRFNPFKDVGGDQSFSLALLDGKNNGLVISSLFTREGTRIYSKAITAGVSEKYPLTDKEKEVIKKAMEIKPTK